MPTGYTTITATKIRDASGAPLAAGKVIFSPPISSLGVPVSTLDGGGGEIMQIPVIFEVVSGEIVCDQYGNPAQIADTTLTTPQNIGYLVTVLDATGTAIQGPGYGFVQPFGASWSLDTYSQGNVLPTGPSAIVVDGVTGVRYSLVVNNGQIALFPASLGTGLQTSIVFTDTVSGTNYALTIVNGAREFTAIGSLGNAVAGVTFIDTALGFHFTLQMALGGLETVQVASTVAGVASVTLYDCANGNPYTLAITDGALTITEA